MGRLSRLEYLDLASSGFSFCFNSKAKTAENTSLKTLLLRSNDLSNPLDLQQLSIFKGLSELDLSYNLYTDFDLGSSDIKTILPNLTILRMLGSKLDDRNLYMLSNQLKEKNVEFSMWFLG